MFFTLGPRPKPNQSPSGLFWFPQHKSPRQTQESKAGKFTVLKLDTENSRNHRNHSMQAHFRLSPHDDHQANLVEQAREVHVATDSQVFCNS